MDPLEDVLALVGAAGYLSTGMVAGGAWAVRFDPPAGIKFNAVRRGSCLVLVDGTADPLRLEPDDAFLLTRPLGFVLASDLSVRPEPAAPLFAAARAELDAPLTAATRAELPSAAGSDAADGSDAAAGSGATDGTAPGPGVATAGQAPAGGGADAAYGQGLARAGSGDDVEIIGGGFTFRERARTLLLPALPPILHIPAATPEAATVRWTLQRIGAELRGRPTGARIVAEHLAMVMFIEALRLHLARSPRPGGRTSRPEATGASRPANTDSAVSGSATGNDGGAGWLAGIADPVTGPALRALHGSPARPWTVAELARVSSVSRSTLAVRFKQVVGQAPLDYLTAWRMELAAHRLSDTPDTLDSIARRVGYGSESALSTAFKRVTGLSPRDYRRAHGVRA